MADKLENMIRQWSRRGEAPLSAPPGERCLTFAQAEDVARGGPPRAEIQQHLASCQYCQRLVADFAEALAEGAAAVPRPGGGRRTIIRLLHPAALAAAASVLLAICLGVFLFTRGPAEPMLASAEVGLQSEIESGLRPKGRESFASGDLIMFRVALRRGGYVMLINLDPGGGLVALAPAPPSPELLRPVAEGQATLGPYVLDDATGLETFLLVATESRISDVPGRLEELRLAYVRDRRAESLVALIRRWPADVKVISFQHVPAK